MEPTESDVEKKAGVKALNDAREKTDDQAPAEVIAAELAKKAEAEHRTSFVS